MKFNEKAILNHFGKVSHELALELAEKEYQKFKQTEDKNYISDFDNIINL